MHARMLSVFVFLLELSTGTVARAARRRMLGSCSTKCMCRPPRNVWDPALLNVWAARGGMYWYSVQLYRYSSTKMPGSWLYAANFDRVVSIDSTFS